MKTIHLQLNMGHVHINDVVGMIYCKDFMRKIHGKDLVISDWNDGHRLLQYYIPIDPNIPGPVKRFVTGDKIKVNTAQHLVVHNEKKHQIDSKVHFHMFGARLLNISSTFTTVQENQDDETVLDINVRVGVKAPPIVKGTIEKYMVTEASKDIMKFAREAQEIFPNAKQNH